MDALQRRLPGRTRGAIWQRARRLRLPMGIPQGCEALTSAARRLGWSLEQLEMIVRAAGVRLLAVESMHRGGRVWRYAPRDELERAVHAWMARETVCGAARARRVAPATLRLWLRRAGYRRPPGLARRHERIASALFDHVVATRGYQGTRAPGRQGTGDLRQYTEPGGAQASKRGV